MMADPLVLFENVVKRMNFEIHEGEFLAFNIISGRGLGLRKVSTEAGTFVLGEDVTKEQNTTFVVATDLMAPSFARPKHGNVVEAQLISEEFVGSMVTLFLETRSGMELKGQVQERALADFKREPGQLLYLSFDPAHAHVLKG